MSGVSSHRSARSLNPSHAANLLKDGASKDELITELRRRHVKFSDSMTKKQLRDLLKMSVELVLRGPVGIPVKISIGAAALKPAADEADKSQTYEDGGHYKGELKEGLRCGHGVHTLPNGGFYDGEWTDDEKNGRGLYVNANGNKFDGEWKDGNKHGQGVLTFSNGTMHVGEWKDDKRNGHGVLTASVGKYDGMWKDDMQNGYGVYTWPDGLQYHGEFLNDKVFGKGTYSRLVDDFTVEHNGCLYKTLGDHRHSSSVIKFEAENRGGGGMVVQAIGIMRELPQGWELAPSSSDSKRVCAQYSWQAVGLVLADGSAICTAYAAALKLTPGDFSSQHFILLPIPCISPSASRFSGQAIDIFPHKTALQASSNAYGVKGLLLCDDILLRKRLV